MRRALFPLFGAALLALSGCGDGDNLPRVDVLSLPAPVPLPECPDVNYASCDIREPACQRQLTELTACLRQSEPLDVPMDVISEDAYRELLRQGLEADTPSKPDHMGYALSVLGLAPRGNAPASDLIEDRVRAVGGYYVPNAKRITIIDHGTPADSATTDTVLVHEIVHALQDADYDLATWPGHDASSSFDARLARSTLVEGEASFYQYRAAVPLFGLDIGAVDFEATIERHLAKSFERALSSAYRLPQSFSSITYGLGAQQAHAAWKSGGPRAIDARWATPPTTMQGVLCELFGMNEPQAAGIEIPEPAVPGLSLAASEVLGAWGLYLFLADKPGAHPVERALGWRGDHLWVYAGPDAETYALWQIELDTEVAAGAIALQLREALSYGAAIESGGARVYAAYSADDNAQSGLSPPPLAELGRAWLADSR